MAFPTRHLTARPALLRKGHVAPHRFAMWTLRSDATCKQLIFVTKAAVRADGPGLGAGIGHPRRAGRDWGTGPGHPRGPGLGHPRGPGLDTRPSTFEGRQRPPFDRVDRGWTHARRHSRADSARRSTGLDTTWPKPRLARAVVGGRHRGRALDTHTGAVLIRVTFAFAITV
jgi:hypothetical protein